eukprot:scaffold93391_cov28-Phaeocystis_antarctica.AAC.1
MEVQYTPLASPLSSDARRYSTPPLATSLSSAAWRYCTPPLATPLSSAAWRYSTPLNCTPQLGRMESHALNYRTEVGVGSRRVVITPTFEPYP